MTQPLILLIFGIFVLLFFLALIWPKKGIIARIKQYGLDKQRVLIEDALKHIYHGEDEGVKPDLESLAKHLSISREQSVRLLSEMTEMGLVEGDKKGIELKSEGRSYALRVIRFHRLWEKYLAEKTGMKELEWHDDAEKREHLLTPSEADELAAEMGNPIIDPHGDPIPDSKGGMPSRRGVSIAEIKEGSFARIAHIEDEPAAVYSQLVAEGLYPGLKIKVIQITGDKIKFVANGEECLLSPMVASNLSVIPIEKPKRFVEDRLSLSQLRPGEEARVLGISRLCRGQQRRRLLDFGFVPGSKITAELEGMGGDPTAYRIKGTTIALRKEQSDLIFIER